MKTEKRNASSSLIAIILLLAALPVSATNQRSFVSSSGSDLNTCTRTLPCRNFAAAIAQTTAGGEVVVIDSAGYGPIPLVDKSVSIIAPLGVHAAIAVMSGSGIQVNAPGASVVLRNIYLTGLGGQLGIEVIDVSSLVIEHGFATGFSSHGILFQPTSNAELTMVDSEIRKNGQNGVQVGVGSSIATATIIRCRFEDNGLSGIVAGEGGSITIKDSVAAGNATGFAAATFFMNSTARVEIDSCNAFHNSTGITSTLAVPPAVTTVRVTNSSITNNGLGIDSSNGTVLSQGNNTLIDNTSNGAFTGTYAPK